MSDDSELLFSSDFAARILGEAKRIAARQARRRRLTGFVAATGTLLALVVWMVAPTTSPKTGPVANLPRLAGVQEQIPADRNDEPDALGLLFPDAVPVARFAAQYSDADDSAGDLLGDEDAGTP